MPRADRAKYSALRRAAFAVLAQWPIEVAAVRLIQYEYNASYRVDTIDGRRFALRLNVNSRRSPAHMRAETSWVRALADDPDISVPVPQTTNSGELIATVGIEGLEGARGAVLYSWLPGRLVGEVGSRAMWFAAGALTARLHAQAESWSLPDGAALSVYETSLMDDVPRLDDPHPALTPDHLAVIRDTKSQVDELIAAVHRRGPVLPLHGDLHGWNLMWHDGRVAAFDFDDSILGSPAFDLPMSAYYIRPRAWAEAAMHAGYESVRPLPDMSAAEYEAAVAGRNIVLLNSLLDPDWPEAAAILPRYVANTVTKLRAYLATGVFRHDVEGLIPPPT